MGGFSRFGVWISQNTQQPLKAESERSENVNSKPVSEKDSNSKYQYINIDEEKKQGRLWSNAERKHPWSDAPPRVKVTTKKGLCHMNIELTVGMSPGALYELFTDPLPFEIDRLGRDLLKNKSRRVLKKNGPREIAEIERTVAVDFLWWSGALPIKLIVDENQRDLTAKYKKEKMMFMKVFEGSYKVEPIFVDSERLCKHRLPKILEEYRKCSGGQGRVASKVIMNQYFQPSAQFNLPPFSWYIRGITIKTTKTLLQMIQLRAATVREIKDI